MQDDVNSRIGQRVAFLRKKNGWSQADLAFVMGEIAKKKIDPTVITRTEKGQRPIPATELVTYSELFGVPVGQLLEAEDTLVHLETLSQAVALVNKVSSRFGPMVDEYLSRKAILKKDLEEFQAEVSMSDFTTDQRERAEALIKQARWLLARNYPDHIDDYMEENENGVPDEA